MQEVVINNKTFTYKELEERFNLPKDVEIVGCNVVSKNSNRVDELKLLNSVGVFEVFGFGSEMNKMIIESNKIKINYLNIFSLTNDELMVFGFGSKQASNYTTKLKETYKDGVPFNLLVRALNVSGVGDTISEQFTRYWFGLDYSTFGLTKDSWNELLEKTDVLKQQIQHLETLGYDVINPYKIDVVSEGSIKVVLTGSPKIFGYKTKAEFLEKFTNLVEVKKVSDCDVLITDDLNSTSSKTKDANKFKKQIKTYGEF